jgi:hypothetical protein
MRKLGAILLIPSLLFCAEVFSSAIVISGIYQGKDLYVKNPFSDDGVGFCVYEVLVNGELTADELSSSAFAIDFNILGIDRGAEIEVIIKHKEGCEPLVLNPEVVKPHSTYQISEIEVKNNVLRWSTTGESGSLPFIVEQFRWNKWVKAGEVQGSGKKAKSEYAFELTPYSGENRVRVKQVDYTKQPRYSPEVTYSPGLAPVSFEPKKVEDMIVFSKPTRYEIFDKYGILVKTGFEKTIDVSNLESKQEYYINYDSAFGETFKKK